MPATRRSAHAQRVPVVHIVLALWLLLALAACAAPTPAPTSTPKPVPPTAIAQPVAVKAVPTRAPIGPAGANGQPASKLADAGKALLPANCSCHGATGQGGGGPALVGRMADFSDRGADALALYKYTKGAMPPGTPGSLKEAEYLQITGFILLQNGMVKDTDQLSLDNLATVSTAN